MDDFSLGIALLLLSPAILFAFLPVGRYLGALFGNKKVRVRYKAKNGEQLEFTANLRNDADLEELINRLSERSEQESSKDDAG